MVAMPSPHPKYVFRKALRSPHDRLLLALATLGLSPLIMGAAIPKRPNLIVILADDLGYGGLSGNNPDSKMPPTSGSTASGRERLRRCPLLSRFVRLPATDSCGVATPRDERAS